MSILEMKKEYNKLLAREKKAEKYMQNCSEEEFDKWCPEFNKIIVQLSLLMKQMPEMTKEEILEGFKNI